MTAGTTSIRAAHDATPNVPIVSLASADPMMMGWAQTMARPGGVIDCVFLAVLHTKRLEVLKVVWPQATRFGVRPYCDR